MRDKANYRGGRGVREKETETERKKEKDRKRN